VLGAVIKVHSEFSVFEQPDDLASFYETTLLVGELDAVAPGSMPGKVALAFSGSSIRLDSIAVVWPL
jgi:hypothetical protein